MASIAAYILKREFSYAVQCLEKIVKAWEQGQQVVIQVVDADCQDDEDASSCIGDYPCSKPDGDITANQNYDISDPPTNLDHYAISDPPTNLDHHEISDPPANLDHHEINDPPANFDHHDPPADLGHPNNNDPLTDLTDNDSCKINDSPSDINLKSIKLPLKIRKRGRPKGAGLVLQ